MIGQFAFPHPISKLKKVFENICIMSCLLIHMEGLYMGLSAATGHLADNHDILGVSVRNLDPDAQYFDSEQVSINYVFYIHTYILRPAICAIFEVHYRGISRKNSI